MTIKGIIFDLDGTLLYTLEDLCESVNYALKKCSLEKITLAQTREFVGNGIKKLIERALLAHQDKFEDCYNFFLNHYSKNSTNTTKPYHNARECLLSLKEAGYKLAILSNKKDDEVKKLSKKYFGDIFDISLGETPDFPKKPENKSALYIIDKFNLKKEEVIFVGDSEVDIQTAKNAQIECLSVSWGYRDKNFLIKSGAKKIFDNFEDLKNFLMRENNANFEYFHWIEYFKNEKVIKKIEKLKKKTKDKKVIFYCAGIFFDAFCESFNLKNDFNVKGISDLKFEKSNDKKYKNFDIIKPSKIKKENIDYIIITSPDYKPKEKFLKNLKIKKTKILNLKNNNNNFLKKIAIFNSYFLLSHDLIKSLEYLFTLKEKIFEAKLNYLKTLHRLKKKDKIRILFIVEENQKFSFQFLYNALENDSLFEVLPVALSPAITKGKINFTIDENKAFFDKLNIKTIDIYDYKKGNIKNIEEYKPDIVFYQQPWHLFSYLHPEIVSKYALTLMAPYGYATLGAQSWGSDFVKDIYSYLWTFFSESPYHSNFYKKTAKMKDNIYATGSLKLDFYKKASKDVSKFKKPENKKIIWAPHHSITEDGLRMSTFRENYLLFLEFAALHPEISFLLKPHPSLKNTCIQANFLDEKSWDDYIKKWCALENCSYYTDGDYFDIFKASDLLITDCASFLAEYYPAKKPIIFLNRKSRAPFDEFGEKIRKGFYEANSFLEAENFIKMIILENKDPLFKKREKILKRNFYIPRSPAYLNVLDFLKKKLGD